MFLWTLDQSYARPGGPDGRPRPQLRPRRAQPRRPLVRVPADGAAEDAAGAVRPARLEPGRADRGRGHARELALWLLVPPLVWLAFFSLFVKPQIGVRYLLPAFPFLFVLAARPAAAAASRRARIALGSCSAWYVGFVALVPPAHDGVLQRADRLAPERLPLPGGLQPRMGGRVPLRRRVPARRIRSSRSRSSRGSRRRASCSSSANELVGLFDAERFRWLRENFRPVGPRRLRPPPLLRAAGSRGRAAAGATVPVAVRSSAARCTRALVFAVLAWRSARPPGRAGGRARSSSAGRPADHPRGPDPGLSRRAADACRSSRAGPSAA